MTVTRREHTKVGGSHIREVPATALAPPTTDVMNDATLRADTARPCPATSPRTTRQRVSSPGEQKLKTFPGERADRTIRDQRERVEKRASELQRNEHSRERSDLRNHIYEQRSHRLIRSCLGRADGPGSSFEGDTASGHKEAKGRNDEEESRVKELDSCKLGNKHRRSRSKSTERKRPRLQGTATRSSERADPGKCSSVSSPSARRVSSLATTKPRDQNIEREESLKKHSSTCTRKVENANKEADKRKKRHTEKTGGPDWNEDRSGLAEPKATSRHEVRKTSQPSNRNDSREGPDDPSDPNNPASSLGDVDGTDKKEKGTSTGPTVQCSGAQLNDDVMDCNSDDDDPGSDHGAGVGGKNRVRSAISLIKRDVRSV